MRERYAEGLVLLSELQRELEYPPKRKLIKDYVNTLVKKAGLDGDIRERYFRLLATCALLAKEPMYNSFKPRRKHGKETNPSSAKSSSSKVYRQQEENSSGKDSKEKDYQAKKDRDKRRHRKHRH